MSQKKNFEIVVEKYNQKGEGIGFINNKPTYIFGAIVGEKLLVEISLDKKTYFIAKIVSILKASKNRSNIVVENQEEIGGYELIHMNDQEQIQFKLDKIKEAYKQIANYQLVDIKYFFGKKRFYYRNKISLHDGFFYKKNTREKIKIDDFKLSYIKPKTKLKGEVIIRELNKRVEAIKGTQAYNYDSIFDYQFRININSFYQINKEVALEAYQDIANAVIKNGISLDLYSGIATIAIIISSISKKVVAVENNKFSVADAFYNIKKNNITNIDFINSDVDKFLEHFNHQVDTLVVDPARSGLNKKIIKLILNSIRPKKIIYLSCNPSTQARDFNLLKNFYEINLVKIFDMFPQTYHCESLLILNRKQK